ncbi:MAG TPA: hypothetical protein VKT28_06655 [Puia sp.]|nr:hypothetical protein [Puia sp.]
MKRLFIFFFFVTFLSGCAATYTFNILARKETKRPFSKVLVMYVDDACELHFLDSTTYDICIRNIFLDSNHFHAQSISENVFSKKLSSSRTTIIKSSDLLDTSYSVYQNFVSMLDSLHIEGVLLVNRLSSQHIPDTTPDIYNYNTKIITYGGQTERLDVSYKCYLLSSQSIFPIWIAQFDFKGDSKRAMASELAKDFIKANYIFK